MTEEQLEFFSAQTEHAVGHALRRYRRAALTGFVILLGGIGFGLHATTREGDNSRNAIVTSTRAVAVDSCNGRYQDREGLRNLLLAAEATIPSSVKKGDITPSQAETAKVFYDRQLAKLRLPDCRRAAKIITSDPGRTVKIPKPLHPPDATLTPPRDAIFSG